MDATGGPGRKFGEHDRFDRRSVISAFSGLVGNAVRPFGIRGSLLGRPGLRHLDLQLTLAGLLAAV